MRIRFDSVVTLPTEERVVGDPRCCCKRHRRRKPVNLVHQRRVHLMKQPPCVRSDRFEIPPLRLGIERAERQRGLARSGNAGEDNQRIARDLDIDIFKIVFACPADVNEAILRRSDSRRRMMTGLAVGTNRAGHVSNVILEAMIQQPGFFPVASCRVTGNINPGSRIVARPQRRHCSCWMFAFQGRLLERTSNIFRVRSASHARRR